MEHKEHCMCDSCVMDRIREKIQQRQADDASEAYIKRRGGLDRPPNVKTEETK